MSQILPITQSLFALASDHLGLLILVAVTIYGFRRFVRLHPSARRDVIDLVKAIRRG